MKLRFLCVNHRMELEGNVSKAIQFWQVGLDTGQYYRDHMLWSDCLLYTSPSPRDQRGSRMPSSA